jgi:type IV secretory pathway VirB4 component
MAKEKTTFPSDATQQFVEIDEIKEDVVILKGGGLRAILLVAGTNFELKSEEEQDIITGTYQSFLNSLDFSIQIIIHSRKVNIDAYLEKMAKIREKESNELLRNQTDEYIQFIKSFVKENEIMTKNFFVVIPYTPGGVKKMQKGIKKLMPFLGKSKKQESKEETMDHQVQQLRQRIEQVSVGLERIGLRSVQLNKEELLELYYNLYNPQTVRRELKKRPEEAPKEPKQ